ncbi:MAG TPA: hypothetical protein VGS23_04070 [Thermoplasmata archaeon]|nr:hypothetical protein [Thermoplasmata archaeon]
MPNVTLSVSKELHEEMRRHPDVKWSQVARRALQVEVERLHIFDELLSGSKLTIEDSIRIGRKVNLAAAARGR